MTPADGVRFAQAFNRLAVATRLPAEQADEAMQRIFWDGLKDMPIESVEGAADVLGRKAQWFPRVSEWRQAAYSVRLHTVLELPESREEPWHHECATCEDSGWEYRTCYPGTLNTCGRRRCGKEANEHRYVVVCACRETNRTYQRGRAVLQKTVS